MAAVVNINDLLDDHVILSLEWYESPGVVGIRVARGSTTR